MAHKIFLSYRRYDTAGTTGRLHDYLEDVFGKDKVFKDVSDIPAGVDFRKVIGKEILDSKIVLVMIGQHYTSVKDDDDQPRLHNPNDFVHIEVVTAVNMKKIVIPVLVDGATMPRADELPEPLKELVNFNAVTISHDRWKSDVNVLVEKLKYHLEPPKAREQKEQEKVRVSPPPKPSPKKRSWVLPASVGVFITLFILFLIGSMMEDGADTISDNNDPAADYVYVNTEELNIRNEPGTEGTSVVGVVYDGDELKVVGEDWVENTKWFNVESNRHRGWVSGNLVTEQPSVSGSQQKLSTNSGQEQLSTYDDYEETATYQPSNAELLIGTWQCYEINGMSLTAAGFQTNYFNFIFYNNGTMFSQITGTQHYYSVEGNDVIIDGQRGDVISFLDQYNLTINSTDNFGNPMLMRFRRI